MSRILLTTLGSLGDLHPLIAVGLVLCCCGLFVWFCVCGTYRQLLESLGFGFDPLRPDATPENASMAEMVRQIMDPKRGIELLIRGYLMARLRETHDDLLRALT